jgi:hypothetical protein
MNNNISDRLRFVMSQTDSPKLLEICSKISYLDIKVQESLLDCIENDIPLELILKILEKKE